MLIRKFPRIQNLNIGLKTVFTLLWLTTFTFVLPNVVMPMCDIIDDLTFYFGDFLGFSFDKIGLLNRHAVRF